MLLKPGWLIAIMSLWVILQLLITIGDGLVYGQNTFGTAYTAVDENNDGVADTTTLMGATSPIMSILETGQTIVKSSNPVSFIGNVITADWGSVIGDLWKMFTFQTEFLDGSWNMVSVFFAIIYAAFGLSILYNFVSKAL